MLPERQLAVGVTVKYKQSTVTVNLARTSGVNFVHEYSLLDEYRDVCHFVRMRYRRQGLRQKFQTPLIRVQ